LKRKKRYKRKPFKPIDRDHFKDLRLLNNLTINQTASLLRVTSRTIALWESGSTRIPYAAFKLLRCLGNGEIVDDAWKGWVIKGDTLWSPTGRAFRVYELTYLSHYFTMARYWLKGLEDKQNQTKAPVIPINLKIIKGGRL
jgi:transcriptional regulator with XRE-family HTH domain